MACMKKIFLSFILVISGGLLLQAQTLESANQFYYHERYQSAENAYHAVLNQQAEKPEAWLGLTKTYLAEEKIDKGFDTILKAPVSIRENPLFQVALGSVLLYQGKKDKAAELFTAALKETKEKDETVLGAIAQSYINLKNGDANYAISLLTKAIKRDKHNPAWIVLLGDAYRKLNNGTEAYKAYKEALDKNENYAAAYYKLGEIFLSQKNPDLYLEYFNKAIAADPDYAPALYQLYVYNFYHDIARAFQLYNQYLAKSDPSIQNQYDLTDLFYLNKEYDKAIENANSLMATQGNKLEPRIYKLLAYSYAETKDSIKALRFMHDYFLKEEDSNLVAKDFELMAGLYANSSHKQDSALVYLEKAAGLQKDSAALFNYYKKLATMAKSNKDYASEAKWMEKFYRGNDNATNVDLFNWGLANFLAQDFRMADSVFGMYVAKYPEQSFGYYWQARSNASLDKDMKESLAIPVYKKLIEVLQGDTTNANYKKWMVEAYAYLAAYEANTQKDYNEAVDYFEKVLEVDPDNADAKRYIAILEKNNSTDGSK
jgi:tetratricopeptide (TPR) repeat protein